MKRGGRLPLNKIEWEEHFNTYFIIFYAVKPRNKSQKFVLLPSHESKEPRDATPPHLVFMFARNKSNLRPRDIDEDLSIIRKKQK